MFTEDQMAAIRAVEARNGTVEEAAEAVGVKHRTSVERRLIRHHQLVAVPVRTFRLVPLTEWAEMIEKKRNQPSQEARLHSEEISA